MRFLILVLSFFLLAAPSSAQVERIIEGVVVKGHSGITRAEKDLLRELSGKMIPLPDTIKVQGTAGTGAWVGTSITLDPERHESPWASDRKMPYLYGRSSPTHIGEPLPENVYTLAHEMSHWIQWQVWNGKPLLPGVLWWRTEAAARGPFAIRRETEADLIAAALLQIAFDMPLGAFGFPENTWAGRTDSLVQGYRGRVGDAYRFSVDAPMHGNAKTQKQTSLE